MSNVTQIDSKLEAVATEAVYVHQLSTPQAVKFIQRALPNVGDEKARAALGVVVKSRFKLQSGKFVAV